MKKFSILALALLSLVGCATNNEKKTAMEWAKMAVEEEHYILDDDGYLLTHTAVIQTPSLEFIEEVEGETYRDYLYVKDDKGGYYFAIYKHTLLVDTIVELKEYTYISAIAWEERSDLKRSFNNFFGTNPTKIGIHEWQIQDIDIEEL